MNKKHTLILDKEFIQYCELNKITNIEKQAQDTFNRGFTLLKYGETPYGNKITEIVEVPKEVIKEVIVEKIIERIVEVPVEIVKEIIKEVIVEKQGKNKTVTKEVIKEVPVEVIREVVNNDEVDRLTKENQQLKFELDKITNSLEKMGKAKFMKNSDMSNLYDE
jgi:signal recognition particle GTPase